MIVQGSPVSATLRPESGGRLRSNCEVAAMAILVALKIDRFLVAVTAVDVAPAKTCVTALGE